MKQDELQTQAELLPEDTHIMHTLELRAWGRTCTMQNSEYHRQTFTSEFSMKHSTHPYLQLLLLEQPHSLLLQALTVLAEKHSVSSWPGQISLTVSSFCELWQH